MAQSRGADNETSSGEVGGILGQNNWLGEAAPCKTRESIVANDLDRAALWRLLDALYPLARP